MRPAGKGNPRFWTLQPNSPAVSILLILRHISHENMVRKTGEYGGRWHYLADSDHPGLAHAPHVSHVSHVSHVRHIGRMGEAWWGRAPPGERGRLREAGGE